MQEILTNQINLVNSVNSSVMGLSRLLEKPICKRLVCRSNKDLRVCSRFASKVKRHFAITTLQFSVEINFIQVSCHLSSMASTHGISLEPFVS